MEAVSATAGGPWGWALLALSAVLIGMSKTGIQGITMLAIPILALFFGGKPSTGIVLPMLCMADIIAVIYYRRDAEWKYILRLLPSAVAGFFVAIAVDGFIPESQFKRLIAFCIVASIAVMLWSDKRGKGKVMSGKWWFAPLFGLFGGFATMIGNAAGPIMAVYLLSMRLPKNSFVGTSAWFFMIVNMLKVPLQIFAWNNITLTTLLVDVLMIPFIAAGAVAGIYLVKKLPEKKYRAMIIWLTVLCAAMLLI